MSTATSARPSKKKNRSVDAVDLDIHSVAGLTSMLQAAWSEVSLRDELVAQLREKISKNATKKRVTRSALRVGMPLCTTPEVELRSIAAQLKELTHVITEEWATRGDGLETVLGKLRVARLSLESFATVAGAS